jgi:hypothetical protein
MEIQRINDAAASVVQTGSKRKLNAEFELSDLKQDASAVRKSSADKQGEPDLTKAEQEYFASAFPGSATEIRQHATYQKNGSRPHAVVGTVVDRKG